MKSCLKWAGSKSQILPVVLATFPRTMTNYHEPFLGSGSVLLGLLSDPSITVHGTVYASDLNKNIIDLFTAIQKNPEGLIESLKELVDDFKRCTGTIVNRDPKSREEALENGSESYYYWIRYRFNERPCPAMFLFLNKTCFRGLYRENRAGHMNVPYGNNVNPSVFDADHLRAMSRLVQGVVFTHQSFERSLESVQPGDFVYVDPPYCVEAATSFTAYTATPFVPSTLFKVLKELPCPFVMSNSDVPEVREAFEGFHVETISCRRAINSKAPGSRANEVFIKNV